MSDKEVIIRSAAEIASKISASAIIIMSDDISPEFEVDIPVLIASPYAMMALYPAFEDEKVGNEKNPAEKLQTLSKTLYHKVSTGTEYITDASATAFINDLLSGEKIVGVISYGGTSSILVHDLKENHMVKELKACTERVKLDALRSVLSIAMGLGAYGREGKPVGTAFIIGDAEEVMKRSHQLVLNPYLGQSPESSYICDTNTWETVKEFAQLDGVFILDGNGYVQAGGRYLDVNAREVSTMKGLGGRHASAAAITRDTEAVAITVSESDGVVRVYRDGIQIMELDPRVTKVSRYG
ncbi:MAG: diadenylate cyclase [ANME-2 cluster archaeon]|nr:diadenylate cyclase [ANME-2 cluster archaeon]MDF1531103.1 diadenylate cyclase [ANME-2 cluster archaeon]